MLRDSAQAIALADSLNIWNASSLFYVSQVRWRVDASRSLMNHLTDSTGHPLKRVSFNALYDISNRYARPAKPCEPYRTGVVCAGKGRFLADYRHASRQPLASFRQLHENSAHAYAICRARSCAAGR